jgi:hypothetical protein
MLYREKSGNPGKMEAGTISRQKNVLLLLCDTKNEKQFKGKDAGEEDLKLTLLRKWPIRQMNRKTGHNHPWAGFNETPFGQ